MDIRLANFPDKVNKQGYAVWKHHYLWNTFKVLSFIHLALGVVVIKMEVYLCRWINVQPSYHRLPTLPGTFRHANCPTYLFHNSPTECFEIYLTFELETSLTTAKGYLFGPKSWSSWDLKFVLLTVSGRNVWHANFSAMNLVENIAWCTALCVL